MQLAIRNLHMRSSKFGAGKQSFVTSFVFTVGDNWFKWLWKIENSELFMLSVFTTFFGTYKVDNKVLMAAALN